MMKTESQSETNTKVTKCLVCGKEYENVDDYPICIECVNKHNLDQGLIKMANARAARMKVMIDKLEKDHIEMGKRLAKASRHNWRFFYFYITAAVAWIIWTIIQWDK